MNSKQQLRTLSKAGLWLALFAVCAAVAAYFVSSTQTKRYSALALEQILPRAQNGGVALGTDQLLQVTNFYAEVAKTDRVAAAAQRAGHFAKKPSVDIYAQADLLVLQFYGNSSNPRLAAAYANAYARAFEQRVADDQAAQQRSTLAQPLRRVAEIQRVLRTTPANSASATALQAELQTLQARITDETINAPDRIRQLQAALPPTSPASPRPVRDALLAFIVALILGAGVVLLRSSMADRFVSSEQAALELGLPVLGELPKAAADSREALEGFRKLRATTEFSLAAAGESPSIPGARAHDARENRNVLLIASPESAAGKSYVTANLSRAIAADGRRVLAIDGDLRRPTLHEQLHVDARPGLGEALAAGTHQWDLEAQPAQVNATVAQRGGSLDVISAGRLTADTAERLSSETMGQMMELAHERYDFVIVDSAPVLAIVDAVVLSRYADAVVLVVDANRSKRRDVRRALQTLRAVDAPVLGIVFNRSKISRREYGYYGSLPSGTRETELST
jgi:capsular exopolysaccharide synthesis family protein